MSKRIFSGIQGSRAIFRIGLPGQDAELGNGPMVFSSENDFLRVHQRSPSPTGEVMANRGNGNRPDARYLYTLYNGFPNLGYIPLIFYSVCVDSDRDLNNIVTYPVTNQATSRSPFSVQCAICASGVWFFVVGQTFSQTMKIRYVVFKNRLV